MTTRRTTLALAAALTAAASTSACSFTGTASADPTSSSPSGTASPRTTTSTTTPTTTSTRTTSRPAAGTSSGTASGGSSGTSSSGTTQPASGSGPATPRCALGQLHVALGDAEGAAGSVYATVTFRNDGAVCRLYGRPGVDGIRADGKVVHAARDGAGRSGSSSTNPVVLKTGGHASFTVRAQNVPSGTATACPARFTRLLVTPPDLRQSADVSADLPSCGGLTVGPVVAGSQG